MKTFKDKITCVHLSYINSEEQRVDQELIESAVESAGVEINKLFVNLESHERVEEKLLEIANAEDPRYDFLVLGNTGKGHKQVNLGSTAEYLMRKTVINLVFVK